MPYFLYLFFPYSDFDQTITKYWDNGQRSASSHAVLTRYSKMSDHVGLSHSLTSLSFSFFSFKKEKHIKKSTMSCLFNY